VEKQTNLESPTTAQRRAETTICMDINLEDASQQAVIAAMHGDLPALAAALEHRSHALAAGQIPSAKALQDGEDAKGFLEDYIRNVGLEAARVKQMQNGFSAQPEGLDTSVCVNYRG